MRSGTGRRRLRRALSLTWLLVVGLAVGLGAPLFAPAQPAPRLFVFASVDLAGRVFGRQLEAALSPMRVSVFGRLHDFARAVARDRPDAVLARPVWLADQGLETHIPGWRNGRDREPFVLVTRGRPLPSSEIPRATVGIVDLLGPRKMPAFARRLLGGQRPAVLRRVTKPADLGALLRLDLAAAVLVPARHVEVLQTGSEMALRVSELEQGEVALFGVHVPEEELRARLRSQRNRLEPHSKRLLGVDEWR